MLAPAEQVKLGVGGFKLEDSNYKPQWNPPSNPAQVPYQARDDQVIDCFKAAEKYGGILVVDHRARDQAIDCYKAAIKYGGILVVDHRPRDQPIDCYKAAKKFGGILVVDYPVRDQTTAAEKYGSQLMKYPATKAPPHMPLTQGYYF